MSPIKSSPGIVVRLYRAQKALELARAKMTEAQRQRDLIIVEMQEIGMSLNDIGRVMDLTRGRVQQIIQRARDRDQPLSSRGTNNSH